MKNHTRVPGDREAALARLDRRGQEFYHASRVRSSYEGNTYSSIYLAQRGGGAGSRECVNFATASFAEYEWRSPGQKQPRRVSGAAAGGRHPLG